MEENPRLEKSNSGDLELKQKLEELQIALDNLIEDWPEDFEDKAIATSIYSGEVAAAFPFKKLDALIDAKDWLEAAVNTRYCAWCNCLSMDAAEHPEKLCSACEARG